jgi:hypothetical protein
VPAGTTLVAFPLPYIVVGEDSYTWATWPGADFAVPEGYFLGPGRNGDATTGPALLSATRVLVDKVFTTGVVPAVTDEMRTATHADLQRWHASAVVVRATPQYDTMRELATGLLGPPQRVLDVWVWPQGKSVERRPAHREHHRHEFRTTPPGRAGRCCDGG